MLDTIGRPNTIGMKSKKQKQSSLKDYKDKLAKSKITIFTSFAQQSGGSGVGVKALQKLRSSLRENNAEYVVEKKRIIARAIDTDKIDVEQYDGSIGTIFGYGDEVSAAKAAYMFSKDNASLRLYGGLFGTQVVDATKVMTLAKLPSRDQLIGQFAGMMIYPLRGLVTVLQANIRGLAVVLNQIIASKL